MLLETVPSQQIMSHRQRRPYLTELAAAAKEKARQESGTALKRPTKKEFEDQFEESVNRFFLESTLHGVKQISLSPFWWKRLLWMTLMVVATVGTIFQLENKLGSYAGNPMAIDIDVQYKQMLNFPAVIICNVNLFRISQATRPKWGTENYNWRMYNVINEVYNDTKLQRISKEKYKDLELVDGKAFLEDSAHQLGDMLQYCRFPNGSICSEKNFETVITDYGVCHAINVERTQSLQISNPGSTYGLYMILNTEDYEAMPGPQRTVGIKVLIYNQQDFPLVTENGFDVAPGFQTSVGLRYKETQKLSCGQAPLHFFTDATYTRNLCNVDNLYQRAVEVCGCLSYNMPTPKNSNYTMCNTRQYFACMIPQLQNTVHMTEESCPQHCADFEYQQYISFAELSPIKVNTILNEGNKIQKMRRNFLLAREATSRFTHYENSNDKQLMTSLLELHDSIHNASMRPNYHNLQEAVDLKVYNQSCYSESVAKLFDRTEFCSESILDYLIKSPKEALRPNPDFLPTTIASHLDFLVDYVNNSLIEFYSLSTNIGGSFNLDLELTGEFERVQYLVRQQLLVENTKVNIKSHKTDLVHNWQLFINVENDLKSYLELTENITTIRNFNKSHDVFLSLGLTDDCLSKMVKQFPESNDVTYGRMEEIKLGLSRIKAIGGNCVHKIDHLRKNWTAYESIVESYRNNYTNIIESIRTACKKLYGVHDFEPNNDRQPASTVALSKLPDIPVYSSIYENIMAFLDLSISKANFASAILKISDTKQFITDLTQHFTLIQKRADDFAASLIMAEEGVLSLLSFYTLPPYQEILSYFSSISLNITEGSQIESFNLTDNYTVTDIPQGSLPRTLIAVNACIPDLLEFIQESSTQATDFKDKYINIFEDLNNLLKSYNETLEIDAQFLKNNLLALNIYVREMSIEVMKQRPAYDFFSLLSDVGGTLGLFLGASLLTLAEIIDFAVGQCLFGAGIRRLPSIFPKEAPWKKWRKKNARNVEMTELNGHVLSAIGNGNGNHVTNGNGPARGSIGSSHSLPRNNSSAHKTTFLERLHKLSRSFEEGNEPFSNRSTSYFASPNIYPIGESPAGGTPKVESPHSTIRRKILSTDRRRIHKLNNFIKRSRSKLFKLRASRSWTFNDVNMNEQTQNEVNESVSCEIQREPQFDHVQNDQPLPLNIELSVSSSHNNILQ